MEEYRKAAAPLDEEAANLTAEIQALVNARNQLTPRLEAHRRLLATEIDQCIAAGNDEEAAAKRADVEELRKKAAWPRRQDRSARCPVRGHLRREAGPGKANF